MRLLVLCGFLLLTACSSFRPDAGYQRVGTDLEVSNGDLESCRQQARAMIRRDSQIDDDIDSQDVTAGYLQTDGTLASNMSEYQESNRYDSIVLDCMAARGYSTGDE